MPSGIRKKKTWYEFPIGWYKCTLSNRILWKGAFLCESIVINGKCFLSKSVFADIKRLFIRKTGAGPQVEIAGVGKVSLEEAEKLVGKDVRWSRGESDSGTRFKYVHNPLDNPKVQRDAIEDPNAVYGYRPREDGSLASFINGKWNDPIAVEGYRQDRIAYHNRNEGAAQQMVSNMKAEGASIQDIARAVNEYRNQSRINAYIDSNGNIKNIDGYNAALARAEKNSYEELIRKGKTPEQIIKSATKGNPAMDACTGLYDTYFDTY